MRGSYGCAPSSSMHPPADPADGEMYSGTSSDFMGSSAAFFRTWVPGAEQSYIRTEQNQDHWLHGTRGLCSARCPGPISSPVAGGPPAQGAAGTGR